MNNNALFESFFIGGFEGSTHRRQGDGQRLDLIASTLHDCFVVADYLRLHSLGIRTARDGARWYLIEQSAGQYDWSSVIPMLKAARETRTQVIWDILHFGWPDDIDVFTPAFVNRYACFARVFIQLLMNETDGVPFVSPINEPSFMSYAAGEKGFFYPFAKHRGNDIKLQFARAIIAGCEAILDVCPQARFVHTDPIINIVADPRRPQDRMQAEGHRQSQFTVWDMISGQANPDLGGQPRYLDILGLNYYIHNQWIDNNGVLVPSHPHHLPLRYMLREVYERYGRPMFVSETGIEDDVRPHWLRYIGIEVRAALRMKIPVAGICLYPIVNHPGWSDDRHCHNGLWDYADSQGERPVYRPLANELLRQQQLITELQERETAGMKSPERDSAERIDWNVLDTAAHNMEEMSDHSREEQPDQ